MSNTANKVKFGLKNCHWVSVTINSDGTATFDKTVHAWPGAVSLSMDPSGDSSVFYADDGKYCVIANNQGYEGDFESALIPEDFREEIMGEYKDANGVMVENADAPIKHFAFMFEFDGDANKTRHIMYNCTCTRSTVGSKTREDSTDPQTETTTLTAAPVLNSDLNMNIVKASTTENTDATSYANWYTDVYQPKAVTGTSTSGTSGS